MNLLTSSIPVSSERIFDLLHDLRKLLVRRDSLSLHFVVCLPRQYGIKSYEGKSMSTDRILTAIGVLLAIVAAFVALEWWALILVLLGLLSGFLSPLKDMAARTGYTVAAIALPTIADALDAIPMAGSYLNAIIDNVAVVIAGIVIANFLSVIVSRLMESDAT